mgnify:CR=1 FL=1
MENKELQKNILDLKYQTELQKINISLVTLTIGILAFVGTFIWYKERLFFGTALSIIISLVSLIFYISLTRNTNKILHQIDLLKD